MSLRIAEVYQYYLREIISTTVRLSLMKLHIPIVSLQPAISYDTGQLDIKSTGENQLSSSTDFMSRVFITNVGSAAPFSTMRPRAKYRCVSPVSDIPGAKLCNN